jgi:hypothetical protein
MEVARLILTTHRDFCHGLPTDGSIDSYFDRHLSGETIEPRIDIGIY